MAVLLQSRADGIIENTDLLHNASRRKRQIPNGRQDSLCSSSAGGGRGARRKQCQEEKATSEKAKPYHQAPLSNWGLCGFGHPAGNSEDWVWYVLVLLVKCLRRVA